MLPLPHSHGTAVQLIDNPAQDAAFTCPDVDTCDQDTNPECIPGSKNYDASRDGPNPYIPGAIMNHNPARETRCAVTSCQNGPGLGCPYYCFVVSTPCEANVEVLAYYDGAPPTFALYDEGTYQDPSTWSPANGINLTYVGARAYSSDAFKCTDTDPASGLPVSRSLNLFIACDSAGKTTDALAVIGYTEQGQCQFYITASHALACGASGVPSPSPGASSSPPPSPSQAPIAGSGAASISMAAVASYVTAGALGTLPIAFALFVVIDARAPALIRALKCATDCRRAGAVLAYSSVDAPTLGDAYAATLPAGGGADFPLPSSFRR